MNPFRDELAAAHAKIAQLEDQVRELENAARKKTAPLRARDQSSSWLIAGVVLFAVMMMMAGGVAFFMVRAPASAETYRGIATAVAPADPTEAVPPIVQPGAVATVAASASAKSKSRPCNCTPGDPLCSCL